MATLPTTRTWVAGNVVTAAQMNSDVRDLGNFTLSGKPLCILRADNAVSVGTTDTDLTFDVEVLDRDGMHTGSNANITAQTAGYYLVTLSSIPIPTTSGTITVKCVAGSGSGASINQNYRANTATGVSSYFYTSPISVVQYLAVGDILKFQLSVTTAATMPSSATLSTTRPVLSAYWLSQ